MGRVASFGSTNVDRVADVDDATLADLRERHDWFPKPGETREVDRIPPGLDAHVTETLLGGKGANQAVAAARAGADSRLFGKVGPDQAEEELGGGLADEEGGAAAADRGVRTTLADRGVDVSAVATADEPTGTAYVFVGPDGENYIAIMAGANGAVDPAYARDHAGAVGDADVLLLQNEVPAAASLALLDALDARQGRDERPTVILDPAPAAGADRVLAHDCVDVVTPNETETDALEGALAAFDGVVIRTRGPEPVVVDAGRDRFEVPPPPASPVDTTGAGDVFAGYLAAERAAGTDLRAAVERACAAASVSVEEAGVQQATPDPDAVRRRLAE